MIFNVQRRVYFHQSLLLSAMGSAITNGGNADADDAASPPWHSVYVIESAWRVTGSLDADRLAVAVSAVSARHDSLRSTLRLGDITECDSSSVPAVSSSSSSTSSTPLAIARGADPRLPAAAVVLQCVSPPSTSPSLLVIDLRTAGASGEGVSWQQWRSSSTGAAALRVDVERGPCARFVLARESADSYVLLVRVHHAFFDGGSVVLWQHEVSALYRGASLPALPYQGSDVARWERGEYAPRGAAAASLCFWRDRLSAWPSMVLDLSPPAPARSVRGRVGSSSVLRVPRAHWRRLQQTLGASSNQLMQAAVALWLHQVSDSRLSSRAFLLATVADTRRLHPIAGLSSLIGMHVNTVLQRATVDPADGVLSALRSLIGESMETLEHSAYPFDAVYGALSSTGVQASDARGVESSDGSATGSGSSASSASGGRADLAALLQVWFLYVAAGEGGGSETLQLPGATVSEFSVGNVSTSAESSVSSSADVLSTGAQVATNVAAGTGRLVVSVTERQSDSQAGVARAAAIDGRRVSATESEASIETEWVCEVDADGQWCDAATLDGWLQRFAHVLEAVVSCVADSESGAIDSIDCASWSPAETPMRTVGSLGAVLPGDEALYRQINATSHMQISHPRSIFDNAALPLIPSDLAEDIAAMASARVDRFDAWLHRRFARHTAAAAEQRPAVVFDADDGSPVVRLSFSELYERASLLARHLQHRCGVRAGEAVGVCCARSAELVVGALAVILSGASYCPLLPELPASRRAQCVRLTGLRVVLTLAAESSLFSSLSVESEAVASPECVRLDTFFGADGPSPLGALDASLPALDVDRSRGDLSAYMIFTSGSTGQPKCVSIGHGAICVGLPHFYSNLFCSVKSLIQWSAVAFDVHISDFMQCWMYGSTLHMLRPDGNVDVQYLTKMAKTYGIGSIQMVPSLARAWLQYLVDSNDCVTLRSLDCLCFIGEALSSQLLLDLRAGNALPRRLINAYGPAECFLCDTVRICDEADLHLDSDRPVGVPIGRSCQGASCFVVDPVSLELLPAGQMGELCIGGPVMLGYHNQPELTARAVIHHARFGRLYRTGDMARVSWHGDLRFEGRVDNQVKINGQRTELGEIESVLRTASQEICPPGSSWQFDAVVSLIASPVAKHQHVLVALLRLVQDSSEVRSPAVAIVAERPSASCRLYFSLLECGHAWA